MTAERPGVGSSEAPPAQIQGGVGVEAAQAVRPTLHQVAVELPLSGQPAVTITVTSHCSPLPPPLLLLLLLLAAAAAAAGEEEVVLEDEGIGSSGVPPSASFSGTSPFLSSPSASPSFSSFFRSLVFLSLVLSHRLIRFGRTTGVLVSGLLLKHTSPTHAAIEIEPVDSFPPHSPPSPPSLPLFLDYGGPIFACIGYYYRCWLVVHTVFSVAHAR